VTVELHLSILVPGYSGHVLRQVLGIRRSLLPVSYAQLAAVGKAQLELFNKLKSTSLPVSKKQLKSNECERGGRFTVNIEYTVRVHSYSYVSIL
jgi:hypothetical protein